MGRLLEGRRALVTGGGSGIGAATCVRMAEEGAAVAVLDVDHDSATAVAEQVGGLAVCADVSDSDALGAAVTAAARQLGGLTTLFNNAGVGNVMRFDAYDDDEWDRLVAVNLRGVFAGIRAVVPHLRAGGGGAIVNMASVSGLRPTRGEAPYSAAKAGTLALTKSAALEYAPSVRVNAVSPGFIDTPLTSWPARDEALRAEIEDNTPLGRVGAPADVADVVVFLCSDLARYVTGQNVVVDGGSTLPSVQADPFLRLLLPDE